VPHPGPDQLALTALPGEPVEPDVAAHLATCTTCRAEVASLRHAVDLARADSAAESAPPPRVWRAITAELNGELTAPPQAPRAPRWRRWLVPAVAAATGLAAGLVIAVGAPAPSAAPVPLAQVTLVPLTTADPRPSGTASVTESDGVREIVVDVTEPAPAGTYLQAWLIDEDATRLYSLGTLTREPDGTHFRATFRLPPNLSLTAFNMLDVSAEPFDGDPGHSGKSLLRSSTI
jgi:hypothetical protein